ncbi:MAG TPA: hypothetical protein ENG83_13895 [Nitrospirae bacterium]|nr:O-Antigen ligase [bacterium BMS3Abin06]HDH13268.1 hypothetical protein [Nitrospirota bacterium]HDZ01764.1 hypothetical protein [Nitrospirota bacterium]
MKNCDVKILNNIKYKDIIRWWLTFLLCFIPFEFYVVKNTGLWSSDLSGFIRRLDLITIIIFFPIALIELYKNRRIFNWLYLGLLLPIIFLGISGLLSGIMNGNSLFVTCYGIFDYIQNFLVIFIFAAFFREVGELNKIFRLLLIIALFLVITAFIQELWAVVSRYILNKDINVRGIYIFQYLEDDGALKAFWRFGIYRVAPFMNSPIIFGLYLLLVLTIYLFRTKKLKLPIVLSLLTGSFLSISRIVYLCITLLVGIQIIKGRKWFVILLIPLVVAILYMSFMPDLNIWKLKDGSSEVAEYAKYTEDAEDFEGAFRLYARNKAVTIWKDHPFLGVGPGMFGGVVSVKYRSHVYEEYNFPINNQYLNRIWGIDQFWFQSLAETGVIGIAAFVGLFISLIAVFHNLNQRAESYELKGLFKGLILCTGIIVIYPFGITLNIPPVLFTYSALAGIGLGCMNNSDKTRAKLCQ